MYAPHTVSLINVIEGDDYAMRYNLTVLHGVMLQASKRTNVNKSGLEDADAVDLFIPFSVQATDAAGRAKRFVEPKRYAAMESRDGFWTLKSGGSSSAVECFFVRGELSEPLSYSEALKTCDHVYRVTSVDIRDFGSADMQHWQVGGI